MADRPEVRMVGGTHVTACIAAVCIAVVGITACMPPAAAGPACPAPTPPGGLALFTMASGGGAPAEPDSLLPPEHYYSRGSRFWRTTLEMVTFNLIMTLFGKYLMDPEDQGFDVSLESIHENLKNGFEWDDNSFSANNFRHPYQGSLYYGGARANGYDFYQSSLFAFGGSWLFEYAGEAHHPSINDWLNTAIGGITLGEGLYRLSDMVLDNTATGSGRFWRELGGTVLSPMRGLNRLITTEAWNVHANPPNQYPGYLGGELRLGMRTLGEENLWTSAASKPFVSFDLIYGDPFEESGGRPFDHFTFGMQVNFNNQPHGIGRLESQGLIHSGDVSRTETIHHLLGAYLHFDYLDNEAYEYGGQSVSGSLLSQFKASESFVAITELHLQAIILGATKSDYFSLSGREYDYGPGVGHKFRASFWLREWEFLSVFHEGHWIHSINGNKADHYVNFGRFKLEFPVSGSVGGGIDYVLYTADRNYDDFPDVSARNPELRLYLMWRPR